MTPIEELILENQRMLLWENWRKWEMIRLENGGGIESVETSEIIEQVKKINKFLEKKETNQEPCCDMDAEESGEVKK